MRKPALPCREAYDRLASSYRKEHPHLDSFDWPQCRDLLARRAKPHHTILDAGCGDGRVFRRLLPSFPRLVGLDLSGGLLSSLKRSCPDALLVQGDILSPPFRPGSFDIVLAFFLLVHIPEPGDLFAAVGRILRKDGLLLCNTIPQRSSPVFGHGRQRFVIPSWDHSFRSVASAAERSGFLLEESLAVEEQGVLVSTVCSFRWPYGPRG